MTIYSLDVYGSQFWTILLFHVWFCFFLTCIQISQKVWYLRWSGIPISLRIFHSLLWSTVKGFRVVSEAEVDIFLEFSCYFYDLTDVDNLVPGSFALSESSLNIWKFSVQVLLKPGLENFEYYFASMEWLQLCGSVTILWHCPSLGLEWNWLFLESQVILRNSRSHTLFCIFLNTSCVLEE